MADTPVDMVPLKVAEAFPVGVFIAEELEARNWSTQDLAIRMCGSTLQEIAVDKASIEILIATNDPNCLVGEETAKKLGQAFGVNPQWFLNLESFYRDWCSQNSVSHEPKWSKEEIDNFAALADGPMPEPTPNLIRIMTPFRLLSERQGWQRAHDKRDCGHPRAFYQDKNWPLSEENYNPETRSGDPPIDYRCIVCALESELSACREREGRMREALDAHKFRRSSYFSNLSGRVEVENICIGCSRVEPHHEISCWLVAALASSAPLAESPQTVATPCKDCKWDGWNDGGHTVLPLPCRACNSSAPPGREPRQFRESAGTTGGCGRLGDN